MGAAKIKNLKCLILFLLSAIFLFTQASYAITIDKIVAFGDSLTDNGNLFALTKKANALSPLVPIVPKDPPYYNGRFSNGPTWAEELAKNLNVPLLNYAYGGSWAETTYDSHLTIPFGLTTQIDYYLVSTAPDFTVDKHLFVLWIGANDYPLTRTNPEYATTNTIATIRAQIEWLKLYGAKNFLLLNIPEMGNTPYGIQAGPNAIAFLNTMSQMHNRKLAEMIAKQKQDNPDLKFILIDAARMYKDIVAYPERYHLKNVKDACYAGSFARSARSDTPEVLAAKNANLDVMQNSSLQTAYLTTLSVRSGEQPCQNPNDYLFWDSLHPTHAAHRIFAIIIKHELELNGLVGQNPV